MADQQQGYLIDVSCPTTQFCAAVDYYGNVLTRVGGTWSRPVNLIPQGGEPLWSISCSSATFCMTVGNSGIGPALLFNGTAWRSIAQPLQGVQSVSCVSPTFCAETDYGQDVSTYNGAMWSAPQRVNVPGIGGNNVVACASATFCAATVLSGLSSTFNGSTWSDGASQGATVGGMSCLSATFCLSTGSGGSVVKWNGFTWTQTTVAPEHNFVDASCASTTFCALVDDTGNAYTYDGQSWSGPVLVDADPNLSAVSCAAPTSCVAVDRDRNAFSFNGATWSAPLEVDHHQGTLNAVSCPTTTFCAAVDNQGNAVTYNGATWSLLRDLVGDDRLLGVTCVSSSFCLAVGGYASGAEIVQFSATGSSAPQRLGGLPTLDSVSCASATFCSAVGLGVLLDYHGSAWHVTPWATPNHPGDAALRAVSCPTTTYCVAAAEFGAITYDGTRWAYFATDATLQPDSDVLLSVSCVSITFCALGSFRGKVYPFTGAGFAAPVQVVKNDSIFGISCVTGPFCAAAGSYYGQIGVLSGGQWTVQRDQTPAAILNSVSCASTTLCVAVDTYGFAVVGSVPSATLTAPASPFTISSSVQISWTESYASHVALRYRTAAWNGGFGSYVYPPSWQNLTGASATQSSLSRGVTYCYSVEAISSSGVTSSWSAERCIAAPLDDRSLSPDAHWARTTGGMYYAGTATYTRMLNAQITRTGAQVHHLALVVATCSTCGVVAVYAGSTLVAKVNLYSPAPHYHVIINLPSISLRTATIVLRSLGTKLVSIDGLGISRT